MLATLTIHRIDTVIFKSVTWQYFLVVIDVGCAISPKVLFQNKWVKKTEGTC